MFKPVAVPGRGEDPASDVLLSEIAVWVHSEPRQALIRRLDGDLPTGSLAAELAYLDEFTATTWNFRRRVKDGPLERNQIDADGESGADRSR